MVLPNQKLFIPLTQDVKNKNKNKRNALSLQWKHREVLREGDGHPKLPSRDMVWSGLPPALLLYVTQKRTIMFAR